MFMLGMTLGLARPTHHCVGRSAIRGTKREFCQNAKNAKLIVALGDNDSGRRAILRAVAEMQSIVSDQELDDLADGSSGPEAVCSGTSQERGH